MTKRIRADEAFEQALQGGLPPASDEIARMQKLASALGAQAAKAPAPDQRFRSRLRNELLAAAAYEASQEEELFAALLEDTAVRAPAEMRQLVKVAAALEQAEVPLPDPAFRFQLRNTLIAAAVPSRSIAMRVADAVASWNTRMRRNLRVMGAMGVAVFMLLGAGASLAASRDSLPGDFLYPLKRFQESAQLVGTTGAVRGEQLLGLARTRLSEIDALLDRGEQDADLFSRTLNTMDELTDEGRDLILEHYRRVGDPEPLRALAGFAREQAADLRVIVLRLPPAARPVAEESLVFVESIAKDSLQRLGLLCAVCSDLRDGGATQALGSDGSVIRCACEQDGATFDDGSTSSGPGGDQGNDGGSNDPGDNGDDDPEPPVKEPTVDLPPLPEDTDEQIEDLIDGIIDPIESLSPTPLPTSSLPSLTGDLSGL